MQHTDALLSSHFPSVKRISAAKDFTLNDNRLKQLPKYALRCFYYPETGGEGTSDIQLTGIIKWAAKIKKNKKSPGLPTKPPKIPGPQLSTPPGKSHAEFLNLNGTQYTAKSKKVALVTVH